MNNGFRRILREKRRFLIVTLGFVIGAIKSIVSNGKEAVEYFIQGLE